MTLTAEWIDQKRDPVRQPDPKFPHGMDVDMSNGVEKTCSIDLPLYPTPRCGIYVIQCDRCGQSNAMTAAGRPDDPRRVTFGCYAHMLRGQPGETHLILPDTPWLKRTPHAAERS